MLNTPEPIVTIGSLNHYLFCDRRAALVFSECVFTTNEHTLGGDLLHEHADKPGVELRAGWTLLRALPLYSDKLGLSGKADLVEVRKGKGGKITEARPVEYKKGPKRKWDNDDAQLCAQALCLEEMFELKIHSGCIYHATSHTRREVEINEVLRLLTIEAIQGLRQMLNSGKTPPALPKPRCEGCSLQETCLPEVKLQASRIWKMQDQLFTPASY